MYLDRLYRRASPQPLNLLELDSIPLTPCPEWVAHAAISICCIFMFLAVVSVTLRFATRIHSGILAKDDWLTLASLVCYIIFCCGVISDHVIAYGHTAQSGHSISIMTNLLLVIESMYIWSMVFLKFALGFFFLRLIKEKRQRWLIYGVLGVTLLFSFIYFNITIFQCGIPGEDLWLLRFSDSKKCLSSWAPITYGFGYTHIIISAGGDIIMCILPIPLVRRAKISQREKLIVGGIIVLAVIGSITSLIRFPYIKALTINDLSFWSAVQPLTIWSTIEPGLGITASSLATLRPLLRRGRQLLRSYRSTTKSGSSRARSGPTDEFKSKGSSHLSPGNSNSRVTGKSAFLLSATRPENSTFEKEENDEEYGNVSISKGYNKTGPLQTMNSDEKGQYYNQRVAPDYPSSLPQPPNHILLATEPPELPEILTSNNWRATWWNHFGANRMNRGAPTMTMSVTDMATRGSQEHLGVQSPYDGSDTSDPIPQQPVQEDGYRRWVIRRAP